MIDDRWLLSDGQIIGRARRTTVAGGVRMSLEMPEGEPFIAELAKVNAASIAQFCDLSRGEWHARKASKEAAQVSSSRDGEARKREAEGGTVEGETDVSSPQTDVQVNPLDPQSVGDRVSHLTAMLSVHTTEVKLIEQELDMWGKILEICHGQSDDAEELPSVPRTEAKGDGKRVDSKASQDVVFTGEEATVEAGEPEEVGNYDH